MCTGSVFILDNLHTHHGKKVQAWLEENKDKIEVFYLLIPILSAGVILYSKKTNSVPKLVLIRDFGFSVQLRQHLSFHESNLMHLH